MIDDGTGPDRRFRTHGQLSWLDSIISFRAPVKYLGTGDTFFLKKKALVEPQYKIDSREIHYLILSLIDVLIIFLSIALNTFRHLNLIY